MALQTANQTPALVGYNAFRSDGVLVELTRNMPEELQNGFAAHGQWVGSAEAINLARLANENTPSLKQFDPNGDRLDVVEYHPAYHALMRMGTSIGLSGSIWDDSEIEQGMRNYSRAVRFMLTSEMEVGHTCPLTMTNACIAPLMAAPDLLKDWMPRIIARDYDSSPRPAESKMAITVGMSMTERQGGSDVRANTTQAKPMVDGRWQLNGEKWFLSAPMCDAFLVLAQTGAGLSCFFVSRLMPDGQNNGFQLQRLKDKLGNRSNASAELHLVNSIGHLIGNEGEGVRTILEMVTLTRLDCALGSAGQMRAALTEAVHHCRHRSSFGQLLIDQPLMVRVLADLALETAAAQALTLRLARSYDQAGSNGAEAGYARVMTPAIKYWVCKTAPAMIVEAMECIGGNGYVEESVMPRLYREAPLNAIWEGSGNIMCLDVLRALKKGPKMANKILEGLAADLGDASGQFIDVLRIASEIAIADEGSARILTEQLALTAAAAEMRRSMPTEIADAFIESRLGRPWRNTYGMMDARYDARAIVDFVCS